MNLASIWDHQAQLRPDGPAIIENHHGRPRETTFSSLKKALEEDLDWADIEMFQILSRIPVDKRHNVKIDYPSLKKILQT